MATLTLSQSIQRRITATLFLSQSLFSAATISAFTLTPILAATLSGSDSLAGLPATVLMLGRAAAAYPLGWLMDRTGRRRGLTLGFLLTSAGLAISALAVVWGLFLALCVGAVFIGMGRAASEQARFAAAEVHLPAQRSSVIGTIVFAGTIGAVGGPLLVAPSGWFVAQFGLSRDAGPYVAGTLLMLLAAAMIFSLLRPDPKILGALVGGDASVEGGEPAHNKTVGGRPLRQIFSLEPVQLAVAAMVIGQLVMTLLMVITPLHMRHHEHTNQAISGVIMAHTLGMFGLSGVTGRLSDRLGNVPVIVIGALILVGASLLTPLSVQFSVLAAALFLLGLGWNFCFIAGSSLLSDALDPQERGRVQGASETMVALASGAGSLGTGTAFAAGGIFAVTSVGLAFALALIAATVWLGRAQSVVQTDEVE